MSAVASALVSLTALASALAEEPVSRPKTAQATNTILVFAAASLKTALDQIGKEWTAETGNAVTFSYAASSALAKQIEQGAPADIFASADLKWMDYLAEKKLIAPESRINLLGNTLVLIAPADSVANLKIANAFPLAEAIGEGKLTTGDPKSVPVGMYAEAALKSLGIWEAVSPKIASAENVRAALAFVARKEAPFGIVYGSDAKSEPLVKVVDVFPEDTHPPIVYPFALTVSSKAQEAKAFLAYLSSAKAKTIFTSQGFLPK